MNSLFLYIDPGTGSMLFSLFIGLAAAATFAFRALVLKLKFMVTGGKSGKDKATERIPFVIFSDHKRYWNVFKPVCDEFEKRGIDVVFYTASPDDPALSADYKHVKAEYLGEGNKPYARLNMLCADIVFATTPGLNIYQWKRSRDVKLYVHIPHTVDDLSGYRMFGLDYYDAVLTTGENQELLIRKIEELRPTMRKKELSCVGSPNLDAMIKRLNETCGAKVAGLGSSSAATGSANSAATDGACANASAGSEDKKLTVLVAPSWGKSGILTRYGEKFLSSLKNTPYNIIVRPHPQTVVSEQEILLPLKEKFCDFEWNFDNDNFDVLNKADILITDFSGVIFDFSLVFDKPVIYADTNFDTLPYDADWINEPMWSFRVLPELGVQLKEEDFSKIEDVIKSTVESKSLQDGRNKVRSECWKNIGESAVKIVDYAVEKQKSFVAEN